LSVLTFLWIVYSSKDSAFFKGWTEDRHGQNFIGEIFTRLKDPTQGEKRRRRREKTEVDRGGGGGSRRERQSETALPLR